MTKNDKLFGPVLERHADQPNSSPPPFQKEPIFLVQKVAQCSEMNEVSIFRISRFLVFYIWSFEILLEKKIVSKRCAIFWNGFCTLFEYKIDHISETKDRKIVKLSAKFISEHCATFWTKKTLFEEEEEFCCM